VPFRYDDPPADATPLIPEVVPPPNGDNLPAAPVAGAVVSSSVPARRPPPNNTGKKYRKKDRERWAQLKQVFLDFVDIYPEANPYMKLRHLMMHSPDERIQLLAARELIRQCAPRDINVNLNGPTEFNEINNRLAVATTDPQMRALLEALELSENQGETNRNQ
jgi:hypothetical protein